MNKIDDDSIVTPFAAIMAAAGNWSDRPFLHIPGAACSSYSDCAVDYSYREAGEQILEVQQYYRSAGYGIGHRVAILLDNRAEFFFHWFALNGLGASVVPINGDMSAAEMGYLLQHSESCLAVALPDKKQSMVNAASSVSIRLPVVGLDELSDIPNPSTPAQESDATNATECALLYTSGSTGKPKGCVVNNEYYLQAGRWYRDLGGLCKLEPGVERLITPLPMVHMNAMACSTMGMVVTGGCVVQLDRSTLPAGGRASANPKPLFCTT